MTQKAQPGRVEIIRHFFNKSDNRAGGMTVFGRHDSGNSFIEISTAVCSKKDLYNRKLGYKICQENMEAGRLIRYPVPQKFRKNNLSRDSLLYIIDNVFCFYSDEHDVWL